MRQQAIQHALRQLEDDTVGFLLLARRMLHEGLASLELADASRALHAAALAPELARQDDAIEAAALHWLMAQDHRPADVRRVATILKAITYTNRVGRYGYDIARVAEACGRLPRVDFSSVAAMGANVEQMMELATQALRENKAPDTQRLADLEANVDAQFHVLRNQCIDHMRARPEAVESYSNLLLVSRYLERAADNLVKLAEKQHYSATGQRVQIA